MSTYKYYQKVENKVDVSPCPCCGHEDLNFYDYNRDESMHGAGAYVKCKNCGHEVFVDGNKIQSDSGRICQLRVIDEWNSQYNLYRNPDADALKKELSEVRHENNILKSVIFLNRINITDYFNPWDSKEKMELYDEFAEIMKKFKNSCGGIQK